MILKSVGHLRILYDAPDSMRQSRGDILSGSHLSPEQLNARQLRIEVANNWLQKLREFEKKNYPAPVAKVMAKTVSAAMKWTQPFTRGDVGAMQITMGNIAGERGENIVKKYNRAEEKITTKNEFMAKIVNAKNSFVAREGQGMVHDGRRIKDNLKAIPGEIKDGVVKAIPQSVQYSIDPALAQEKKDAEDKAKNTQKEVIEKAQDLEGAAKESTKAQTEAEKKGEEAQNATKEVKKQMDQIIEGKPKKSDNSPDNNTENSASGELRKKLTTIKVMSPREQLTELRSVREGYIRDQLTLPDEKQQKMIADFVESKKAILPTIILDEEFNKKLSEGKLTAEDIQKQPILLDLFLKEKGEEFYASLTESEKNDLKIINELLASTNEMVRKLEEAEESTRKLADAINNKQRKEEEYFRAAENAKNAQSELNRVEGEIKNASYVASSRMTNNSRDSSEYQGPISAYVEYRRERFQNMIYSELGGNMSTRVEREKSGDYVIVSKTTGEEINESGWSRFSSKREARRAQLRYELFSESPLDAFLSQSPDYISKIMEDPIIENLWNKLNPGEKMRLTDFRRIIMAGLMRVMDPVRYKDMSYREMLFQSGGTMLDEFRLLYANRENRARLGLENSGMGDIRRIMNFTVSPDTWNLG